MMKKKAVIRVAMEDAKKRSKAMKTVVGVPGVISASIEGAEKNQIVVIGEEIDFILLTTLLRKSMGYADLFSVAAVDEKKEKEKEKEKETKPQATVHPVTWPYQDPMRPPLYYVQDTRDNYQDPCCIM